MWSTIVYFLSYVCPERSEQISENGTTPLFVLSIKNSTVLAENNCYYMKQLTRAVIIALGMIALVACSNGLESKVKELENLAEKLETTAVANRAHIGDKIDMVVNEINEHYDELTEDQVRRSEAAYERVLAFIEKVAADQFNAFGDMLNGAANIINQVNDMIEEDDDDVVINLRVDDEDEEYDDEDEDDDDDEEYDEDEEDEEDEDEDAAPNQLDEEIERYEKLVNKFISNQKKGMDILSNLSTYEKAQDAELELADKTDRMSSKQQNKYYALMKKLSNAYLFGKHD